MNNEKIRTIIDRESESYDRLTWPSEFLFFRKARRKLISDLRGNILEIGMGTGANLPFYRKDVSVTGIDLSTKSLDIAREKARKLGVALTTIEMDAEDLHFPDRTFDVVISTLTLCTASDPVKVIREMRRVVKKGGMLRFVEHGKSSVPFIAWFQERKKEAQLKKHACHLTRKPIELVKSAGLVPTRASRSFFGIISTVYVDL